MQEIDFNNLGCKIIQIMTFFNAFGDIMKTDFLTSCVFLDYNFEYIILFMLNLQQYLFNFLMDVFNGCYLIQLEKQIGSEKK